mmetsp:Transcript_9444/g.12516  ORF Transcript_9444/g.12516 Transcript_9444/m.12516 type:complete len:169 (-) Transcript_9444:292-798(-)
MKTTFAHLLWISSASAFIPQSINKVNAAPSSLHALPDVPIDLTSMTSMTSSDSLASIGALAAGAAAGPAGIAAASMALAGAAYAISQRLSKSKTSNQQEVVEPEPVPVDLSIPYDAAATLAYCSLKGTPYIQDAAEYEKFKSAYEKFTIAEVSFKKANREYDAFKAMM